MASPQPPAVTRGRSGLKGTAMHQIGFPVFSLAFTPKKPRVVVGGGGGPNKSGVKNAAIVYEVNEKTLDMRQVASHYFTQDDDGCMSLAVHPREKTVVAAANCPEETGNENMKVFTLKESRLLSFLRREVVTEGEKALEARKGLKTVDRGASSYQRVTAFSPDGNSLATGLTDGKLVCVSETHCYVTNVPRGDTVWSIEKPVMSKSIVCDFRGSKFGRGSTEGYLFLVINARSRKKSYLCKWDTSNWTLARTKVVGLKPTTAFAMSFNGELLGLGSNDSSITVYDASSLQVCGLSGTMEARRAK
ncbi:hypothetical protein HK101_009030 [Irineochytrium annulatum]|nr:hypothetical protein HK101_009030 [Irineochytrium annulatum]